tara:strand:- start:2871 stop:3554 length:684 start_codon:yes stop_codon:yes gene_type:complete
MDSVYFSNKRAHANRNFNSFGGSVAQSFNNGSMFEEFDGFSGIASNDLRGFKNASGCDSYNNAQGGTKPPKYLKPYPTIGETYTSRQTGGAGCPDGCLPCHNGVGCCGEGAPETPCAQGARQVNRKSRRASADRVSVNPVGGVGKQIGGTDCGGKCGQHWGITCPSGCRCSSTLNGVCESTDSGARRQKATKRQLNFSHHSNFVAPVRGFKPARSFSGGSSRCALDR